MLENIMEDIAANLFQSDSVIDLYMIGPLPSPHISTIVLPFLAWYKSHTILYLDNHFYISLKTGWRNRYLST